MSVHILTARWQWQRPPYSGQSGAAERTGGSCWPVPLCRSQIAVAVRTSVIIALMILGKLNIQSVCSANCTLPTPHLVSISAATLPTPPTPTTATDSERTFYNTNSTDISHRDRTFIFIYITVIMLIYSTYLVVLNNSHLL